MKKLTYLLCSSLIITTLLFSCSKNEEITTPQVVGVMEKVGNIGYKDLDAAAVKWYLGNAIDPTVNPLLDEKGDLSANAKQPITGFTILASSFGGQTTRSVSIPQSNYVYVSPFGYYLWYYENDKCDPDYKPKTGQTPKDFLYQELNSFADFTKVIVSVKVDGVEYMTDKSKFRIQSDVIELTVHKDFDKPNCNYAGQKAKLISDGFAILMKLPKGKHTIIMKGEDNSSIPAFVAEVTWNVIVE